MPVAVHKSCAEGDHGACPQVWQHPAAIRTKRWWRCMCECHPNVRRVGG